LVGSKISQFAYNNNIGENGDLVSQNLSFVLTIGSGIGYYLFKDD